MEISFDPRLRAGVRIAGLFLLGGALVGAGAGSILTPLGLVVGAFVGLTLGALSAVASVIAVSVAAGPEQGHGRLSERRMRRALFMPPLIVIGAAAVLATVITVLADPTALIVIALAVPTSLIVATPMVLLILNASASFVLRPVLPGGTSRPKRTLVVAAWTTPVVLATVAFTVWTTALS